MQFFHYNLQVFFFKTIEGEGYGYGNRNLVPPLLVPAYHHSVVVFLNHLKRPSQASSPLSQNHLQFFTIECHLPHVPVVFSHFLPTRIAGTGGVMGSMPCTLMIRDCRCLWRPQCSKLQPVYQQPIIQLS